tara:strand:+ start:4391 stop:5950 length:1560 start_codon:yes stop_codon:yes gene_type:complete
MENVIRFGIYRFTLLVFSLLLTLNTFGQDYYISLEGDTQYMEITTWCFNQFYFETDTSVEAVFCDDFQSVYRAQSKVSYLSYSSFVEELDYVEFLLPSIASLRALSTDYFRDEHVEAYISGDYILYRCKSPDYTSKTEVSSPYMNLTNPEYYQPKFDNPQLFKTKENKQFDEIHPDVVFIYHDSLGFEKISGPNMEQDYFELIFSRYSFNSSLNDSIFNGDFTLKSKDFLEVFSEEVSPLTAVQYNDKDLAKYYISALRNGALILLLNLDLKKILLYREAGNDKLANQLETELLWNNLSYAIGFSEANIFDFCKVYIAEAKNRTAILNGTNQGIFLNANLELDSTIILKEEFFLFARKGQVFETQAINQNNSKRKEVTSTSVIQDAIIIYDHNNTQLMSPFPFFVREATALFPKNNQSKKSKGGTQINDGAIDYNSFSAYIFEKYSLDDLKKSNLAAASIMNSNLYHFYHPIANFKTKVFKDLKWKNTQIYENGKWKDRSNLVLNISGLSQVRKNTFND